MGFWLRWFGVLVGAISVFSLMQKLYGLGLAPIFEDMLNFYHAVLHPVANAITAGLRWLLSLIHVRLPEIPSDVVILWVVIGSAMSRFSVANEASENIKIDVRDVIAYLAIGLIFWPVLLILMIITILTDAPTKQVEISAFRSWGIEIAKVVLAFLIIFGINAYSA